MNNLQKNVNEMGVIDAIYHRRSVRNYDIQTVDRDSVNSLLNAAVHASTAKLEEAWTFVVIQDKKTLNRLSDRVKELLVQELDPIHPAERDQANHHFADSDFNAFYNGGTLIVICGKPMGPFVAADCWLAAQNLMLAAFATGLGSCVIGLTVAALNTPEWKIELGIPEEITAIAPILIGIPAGETPLVKRKSPEVLSWS